MTTSNEHKLARALVEAHVPDHVAPLLLDAIDGWHEVVAAAEVALERMAVLDVDAHLSVKQVAEWFNVSDDAVYKLVQSGALPDRRVGGQIRIPVSAARAYLDEQTTTHERPQRRPRQPRIAPSDADTVKRYPWLKGA